MGCITLSGYQGYMLSVRLKKMQGTNSLLAYLTSLPVLFCYRTVSIPENITDRSEGRKLSEDLNKYRKKIADRSISSIDNNLSISQIQINQGTKRQTTFNISNCVTDNSTPRSKGHDDVTLIEDDIVNVLKNTKQDKCENRLIISGPVSLLGNIEAKTALGALHHELTNVKYKGRPYDLETAMNAAATKQKSDVCVVSVPMPNSLNLKHIIIPAVSRNITSEELQSRYSVAIKQGESLTSNKAGKCSPLFLSPMGTGKADNAKAVDICITALPDLYKAGEPVAIICYPNNTNQVYDKINGILEGQAQQNSAEIFNEEQHKPMRNNDTQYNTKKPDETHSIKPQQKYQGQRINPGTSQQKQPDKIEVNHQHDITKGGDDAAVQAHLAVYGGQATSRAGRVISSCPPQAKAEDKSGASSTLENHNPLFVACNDLNQYGVGCCCLPLPDSTQANVFVPIYHEKNGSGNMTMGSVNAGDVTCYVSGAGINKQFEEILRVESKQNTLLYGQTHDDCWQNGKIGELSLTYNPDENLKCCAMYHDDILGQGTSTTGSVFIDVFKDDKCPYNNKNNNAMIYTSPPNHQDFVTRNLGDKIAANKEFCAAVRKTAKNMILAVEAYNKEIKQTNSNEPCIEVIRMSAFSSGIYSGRLPVEVITNEIQAGIIDGLSKTKQNKRTIQVIQYPDEMARNLQLINNTKTHAPSGYVLP